MFPLSETPWAVESGLALVTVLLTQGGLIAVAVITHRKTGGRLTKIEASTEATATQVSNSHTTNLRDDIDKLSKHIARHRAETAEALGEVGNAIAGMQDEFRGHVKQLGDEQIKQTAVITTIQNDVARQAETTAANKEAATIAHSGIFRRLSVVENKAEKMYRWKNVWPWQAHSDV